MMNVLLAFDIPGGVSFRHPWPRTVLALLVALAVLVPVILYARERALSPIKRAGLGLLRVLLFLLLLLLLLEPVTTRSRKVTVPGNILVLIDNSESMAFKDDRKRPADLEDAALALGKMGFRDRT